MVFLRTTCGQPWQFHLWLLSHRTGQIFRPVEGFDRTLSSNGTVQYFHSNNTEMMNQVEFELFQWLLPSGHAQSATLANPSCIHATTPFVYKRPVKFSIVKAKSLTSILAFEFLNGYRRLNVCTVSEIREYPDARNFNRSKTSNVRCGVALPSRIFQLYRFNSKWMRVSRQLNCVCA